MVLFDQLVEGLRVDRLAKHIDHANGVALVERLVVDVGGDSGNHCGKSIVNSVDTH